MPNRLARETSPYLLQHADNPVDWYPWGPEAFAAARQRDVPILLSVGYSACHWCHVMERESFQDPTVAERMNRSFVCVKVDREERPDVDALYQGVVQLLGRGGGWPLTVFLAPDGKPYFGGTYFPPEDRYGLPGFQSLLEMVDTAWRERRHALLDSAKSIADGLVQLMRSGLGSAPSAFGPEDIRTLGERLARAIDPDFGGFGGAPKFPLPDALSLLLRAHRRGSSPDCLSGALFTLESVARGGIFDQLGGGFHRYSVDAAWAVPHFEKMLCDNAQLVRVYSEAWLLDPRPSFERVVAQTVDFLGRELSAPGGGFCSALDADSEGEEGRFYLFTREEVEAAAGPALAPLLCAHLGVGPGEEAEMGHGRFVLRIAEQPHEIAERSGGSPEEVEALLERGKSLLLDARQRRVRPGRDDKVLAGYNGLAIGALARASRAFARPAWAARAARAADFVLDRLLRDGRLLRAEKDAGGGIDGQLEDYGHLVEGLAELYMATFQPRYLEASAALAEAALDRFWDDDAGAFHATARDGEALVVPVYATRDDASPSGASTLTCGLVLLAGLTSRARYLERAAQYLSRMRAAVLDHPIAFGHLACAADAFLDGAATLVLAGPREAVRELLAQVNRRFEPSLSVAWADPAAPPPALLAPTLEGKRPLDGRATAYLCREFTCLPPRAGPEAIDVLLPARLGHNGQPHPEAGPPKPG